MFSLLISVPPLWPSSLQRFNLWAVVPLMCGHWNLLRRGMSAVSSVANPSWHNILYQLLGSCVIRLQPFGTLATALQALPVAMAALQTYFGSFNVCPEMEEKTPVYISIGCVSFHGVGNFSSPKHPYRLWGTPSHSTWTTPQRQSIQGDTLASHHNLMARLRMFGVTPPLLCFHNRFLQLSEPQQSPLLNCALYYIDVCRNYNYTGRIVCYGHCWRR
jgi:hypothetical protein